MSLLQQHKYDRVALHHAKLTQQRAVLREKDAKKLCVLRSSMWQRES